MTYNYFTNNTCTTGQVVVGTVNVTSGSVPNSASVTFSSAGTFFWQAVYSGDANNSGASSPCTVVNNEELTVTPHTPSIATVLSASSIQAGGSAYDTSTLSGTSPSAGGTVTYNYFTNNTCTTGQVVVGTVNVTSGSVPNSASVTFSSAGTFFWQAVYSGDTNNSGASSPCTAVNNEELTVTPHTPSIATALSSSSIQAGGSAYDTSTLSGTSPSAGGTVTYNYFTNNTCTTGQVVVGTVNVTSGSVPNSASVTFSSAGTFFWQAVYSGDTNNSGASSPCTAVNNEELTVTPHTPSIATVLSASSIQAGGSAYDTSTLSGAALNAGGTVTYSYFTNDICTTGQVVVGTVNVTSGSVPNSASVTFSSAGTFFWQAVYSGDTDNVGASSPCTAVSNEELTVTPHTPSIATVLSASSIQAGGSAYDTSALSGAASNAGGTVTYSYFTNDICTTGQVVVGTSMSPAVQCLIPRRSRSPLPVPSSGRRCTVVTPTTSGPPALARRSTMRS